MPDLTPADGAQTPDEWCKRFSVTVHGPDGWRGKSWDEPITEDEFWRRVAVSSCEMPVRGLGGGANDEGVAVGCAAATAGAPVSPVQATDHAGDRVSPVTDDMAEAALLGAMGYDAAHDDDETPKGDDYFRAQMRAALSAALAGCTVVAAPELIELPKFQGCTDSNPDLCACGEAALMCAACDEEIEDSSRAYTVREKCKPWLADDDRDQEWQDVWWHFSCDERGPVSPKGDNTDDA